LVGSDSWGCVSQIGLQIPLPERYYLAFATFEGQEAVAEYQRQLFLFRILKYEQLKYKRLVSLEDNKFKKLNNV
jgi:hypothetical protein